jgi:anti-anti-sigma regulatory factor
MSIVGNLVLATSDHWPRACVSAIGTDIRVDLSATMFIDCRGYSALAAARQTIEVRGGTLTLQGARAVALLLTSTHTAVEPAPGEPVRSHQRCTRTAGRSISSHRGV